MSAWMDLKPAQLMHSICLNREKQVLESETIWLCLACETCAARCPQQMNPSAAMTAARLMAMERGIKPRVKEVGIYYRGFVDNMRLNGKIHDSSVAGFTQLLTGQLIENLPLAWKLLIRGRVKPPPLPFGGGKFRKLRGRSLKIERSKMIRQAENASTIKRTGE